MNIQKSALSLLFIGLIFVLVLIGLLLLIRPFKQKSADIQVDTSTVLTEDSVEIDILFDDIISQNSNYPFQKETDTFTWLNDSFESREIPGRTLVSEPITEKMDLVRKVESHLKETGFKENSKNLAGPDFGAYSAGYVRESLACLIQTSGKTNRFYLSCGYL